MYRFLWRPKWIAFTLLVAALVVTMVNLGLWQLRRLDQRKHFNETVRRNGAAPTEVLGAVLTPDASFADIEWRTVGVSGTYLADRTVTVVNRSQEGDAGRDVVTPLLLDDGSVLLVNRGFVPQLDPAPAPPTGRVEIVGRLRRSETRHIGQPEDASGVVLVEVHRVDIAKLSPQMGRPVQPMFLELTRSDPAEAAAVKPVQLPQLSNGPHLSYAIQWFIFSMCAAIGWVFAVRRSANPDRPHRHRGPPPILESER